MQPETVTAFERLLSIVRHLRSPEGCAWDREQTTMSLRRSLVEEAYECLDAIERDDVANVAEELGDVYLIATMLSVIEEESGRFTVADALEGISDKLIRRHPHVFGDSRKTTVDEITKQWDDIKKEEKSDRTRKRVLDAVPVSLPPLERALEIQRKVSKVGFDWKSPPPVFDKIREETAELLEAIDRGDTSAQEAELGDILFSVVNLGRLLGIDPDRALAATNREFIRRFDKLEDRVTASGAAWQDLDLEQLDEHWDQVKIDS